VSRADFSSLLVAPLTAASCARNRARQPERAQRQGRRFGNGSHREGPPAKADVICIPSVFPAWNLEGEP